MCALFAIVAIKRGPVPWYDRWAPWVVLAVVLLAAAAWLFVTIKSMHETWNATREGVTAKHPNGFQVIRTRRPKPPVKEDENIELV